MLTARPLLTAVAATALLLAAGCDQPKPREAAAPAAPPAAPAETGPVPAAPAWAGALLGRNFQEAFPGALAKCDGNMDRVDARFAGASPGTRVEGWGWDPAAKKAVERVILVDGDGAVVGGGETGRTRPDVPAAKPDITSTTTGWTAVTIKTTGPLAAYGIVGEGVLCPLGRLDL